MALESVVGSINQNYIAQQKNESSIEKKGNAQEVIPQDIAEDIDYSNMNQSAFGAEVKELLDQAKDGSLETAELQSKMEVLKNEHLSSNNFTYQGSLELTNVSGSFAQSQANISQASVAKLLN